MNYYKKILNYLLSIGILVSINSSQDLSIDLILLNTGEFTLNSWNNVSELWKLEIKNTDTKKIDYFLKFILKKNNELIVEGHTKPLSINSNESITYDNSDPLFAEHILAYYYEASDFTSNIINNLGYLPPGTYNLELIAVNSETEATISSDDVEIVFTVGDQFSILDPNDGQVFPGGGNFYFQWDTPGFRQGVKIEFRIIISAIISEEVDSPEDAIELGSNAVFYYDSDWSQLPLFGGEWPYVESGYSDKRNFWYFTLISDTGMEQFKCGFDYAWRMDCLLYTSDAADE